MPVNKKYSNELRIQIVKEYLEGKNGGWKTLHEKYGVHKAEMQYWVDLYQSGGIEALIGSPKSYSGEFKINAVEYMHQNSLSVIKAAAHFCLPSRTSLARWEKIYREKGKEALLEEQDGFNKMKDSKKEISSKKNVNENEDLLAEVQRLRMENAYLKKLNALIQEREKQQQKSK